MSVPQPFTEGCIVARGNQEVVVSRFTSGTRKRAVDEGVAMAAVDMGCAGTQSCWFSG